MLSVLSQKREGFRFYFALSDGILVCDDACPQKELMLRTLVNKCMNDFVPEVRTRDNWGVPLERFGFSREGEFWVASYETLKLPHDCGH